MPTTDVRITTDLRIDDSRTAYTKTRGLGGKAVEDMLNGVGAEFTKARRFRTSEIENVWSIMTDAYRMKEVGGMLKWQSTAPPTRIPIAIDLISAFTWQLYLGAGDQILEHDTSYGARQSMGEFASVEGQIRRELQRAIRKQLNRAGLDARVLELIRTMLLYGLAPIKCAWEQREFLDNFSGGKERLIYKGSQSLEMPLFPGNYYADPSCTDRYQMTTYRISKDELVALAEANPDIYDVSACREVETGASVFGEPSGGSFGQWKMLQSQSSEDTKAADDLVTVMEVWGGLPNGNGAVVRRFSWAAVSGGKFVVKPRYYGAWDTEPPLVIAKQNPRPHQPYPLPWMYYFYHSADAIGTIRRALIDKSQWVNRPLVFINRNALASRMTAGMFEVSPGMMIEKHTGEDVLEVNDALSRFNPEVMSVLGVFEGDMAMSGHNELLHGGASPRGRTTAEEIITRRTMLGAQQQFLVQMLETALSKLFTKVRNHILQYQPVEDWLDLGTVFGDDTDPAVPPEKAQQIQERKQAFMKFFKGKEGEALRYAMVREPNVIVSGITAAYKRTQESEALSMVMKLFFENPLAAFAMGIDPARVGREFLWRIDGIDPNALIVADEEERKGIIETAVQAITSIALGQAGQTGMQGAGAEAPPPSQSTPGVGAVSPGTQGRK